MSSTAAENSTGNASMPRMTVRKNAQMVSGYLLMLMLMLMLRVRRLMTVVT
jgi:hypothetical protein